MQSPDGKGDGKAGDAKLDKAEAGVGNTGAGTPDTLAQATPQTAQVAQPSISPASASPLQPLTPSVPPIDPSTAATAATQPPGPAAGAGPSPGAGPGVSGIPTGGGGSVAPPSGGGMPSMPPMPLGAPATPSPAGPLPPAPPPGPGVNPASTLKPDILAAPIPVSAARAERDAILAASTAGALAAGAGTNAALVLARRIGAALNVGATDFGFFWVTGLTTDGTIVVANSYGLGYIPDGVNLPDNVKMATADESIPLADRAKWVTYPILAVQGWAQAHNQKLRAVIATDAQFANFDPGAAKIVLQAEDIPDSGAMQGRNRLAVIAPGAAAQLASIGPAALNDVLPAPPSDTNPPEDRSAEMWFDVAVPLMSTATDRGIAHMQQFVQYAEHAQELALYQAHTAADGVLQRAAIADWVYWQHLGVLMSDAIGTTANV